MQQGKISSSQGCEQNFTDMHRSNKATLSIVSTNHPPGTEAHLPSKQPGRLELCWGRRGGWCQLAGLLVSCQQGIFEPQKGGKFNHAL